jgi:transposase
MKGGWSRAQYRWSAEIIHELRRPAVSDSTVSRSVLAFGIDLGATRSHVCAIRDGKIEREFVVKSSPADFEKEFAKYERGVVLMEVCGMSPWASKALEAMNFEVIVCQATVLKETVAPKRKNDRDDARALARLCAEHRSLLRPVKHRPEELQKVMRQVRIRATHVEIRAKLVNVARGLARSTGAKIEPCSPEAFPKRAREQLSSELVKEITELLASIERVSKTIAVLDKGLSKAASKFPETKLLAQVAGVGPVTSLTYVVTIQDPSRFPHTRTVGNYVGLTPKQYQSGDHDPQLRISKAGDSYLRSLLVQCAHYILNHENADSDLRRFGVKMAEHGGPRGRKRAIVAVARRLSVLLLSLWKSGEVYEPLRNTKRREEQAAVVTA